MKLLRLTSFVILIIGSATVFGQTAVDKQPQSTEAHKQKLAADAAASERRMFAVAQLVSLADEARGYYDLALRPHVLVRAADALWEADNESARRIFRRAWDAAEAAFDKHNKINKVFDWKGTTEQYNAEWDRLDKDRKRLKAEYEAAKS